MKKIITIIGARPQFIKSAIVSRSLKNNFNEMLIHTGQHYDKNMSDVFFEELNMIKPKYNLGIKAESHGKQTGEMIIGIEKILLEEKPDYVLLYGDTNSTMAGALATSKLLIPIIHIECGLRAYDMSIPEEKNRLLTDHLSNVLFCPNDIAVENLKKENISKNVYNVGDVMIDSALYYGEIASNLIDINNIKLVSLYEKRKVEKWYLATIHRVDNTQNSENLNQILKALNELEYNVIFPVHPRTRNIIDGLKKEYNYKNIYFVEPVDYFTMLYLTKNAVKVITDSGGLQKECYFFDVPCISVKPQTEWVETLKDGYNILAKPDYMDLLTKINNAEIKKDIIKINYYGNGHASEKICEILKKGDI